MRLYIRERVFETKHDVDNMATLRLKYKLDKRYPCWKLNCYNYSGHVFSTTEISTDGVKVYYSDHPNEVGLTFNEFESKWPGGSWKIGGQGSHEVRKWLNARALNLDAMENKVIMKEITRETFDKEKTKIEIPIYVQTFYGGGN